MMIPVPRPATAGKLTTRRNVSRLITLGALLALAFPAVSQAECPNEALRRDLGVSNVDPATGQPYDASLPDCRTYEQVSPVEKDDGSGGVLSFGSILQVNRRFPLQALATGSAITYPGEPVFDVTYKGNTESEVMIQYTSVRSAGGWSTHIGDTLNSETVPAPVLPAVADGTSPQVLEELPTGSKVFFLDESDLLPGISNAATNEPDLYQYTVPSALEPEGHLEDLTVDAKLGPKGERLHSDVRGILGVGGEGAEEGSDVYFVAGGALAQGASSAGCGELPAHHGATGEGCNLYLRRDGVTTFIATLSPGDEQGTGETSAEILDWPAAPKNRTAEVSPNGQYLAFSDIAPTGQYAGIGEILRYDAEAAEKGEEAVLCVSCRSTEGNVSEGALIGESSLAEINGANRQRYMLNDGRVLFNTNSALVPWDVNHQVDVYEWEEGAPHLISGGTSEVSSSLLADASANGDDVFFTTSQSLVPQDQDEITDLYDAREGGGFPAPPPPACSLEKQCPNEFSSPPTESQPASALPTAPEQPSIFTNIPSPTKPKATKAQLLAKALARCGKKRSRASRRACDRAAKFKYGPTRHNKTAHHKGSN